MSFARKTIDYFYADIGCVYFHFSRIYIHIGAYCGKQQYDFLVFGSFVRMREARPSSLSPVYIYARVYHTYVRSGNKCKLQTRNLFAVPRVTAFEAILFRGPPHRSEYRLCASYQADWNPLDCGTALVSRIESNPLTETSSYSKVSNYSLRKRDIRAKFV